MSYLRLFLLVIVPILWRLYISWLFLFPRTPLHEAVVSGNEPVFTQLLQCKQWVKTGNPLLNTKPLTWFKKTPSCASLLRLDLELKDHEGSTALWLALQYITVSSDPNVNPFEDDALVVENGTSFDENSFAAQLIQRGSNPDAPDTATGKMSDLKGTC